MSKASLLRKTQVLGYAGLMVRCKSASQKECEATLFLRPRLWAPLRTCGLEGCLAFCHLGEMSRTGKS